MRSNLLNKCLAEFLGTYALVFFGCGSMIMHQINESIMPGFVIPIIFGLIICIMIYAFGDVSGAHFNPAVSVGFCFLQEISIKDTLFYIIAQCIGAILASTTHLILFKGAHDYGKTKLHNGMNLIGGISFEVILTFFLMLVILFVSKARKNIAIFSGVAIGAMVAIASYVGGPYTGSSMNPARSIGPAFLANDFNILYIYIIFPVLGSLIACLLYKTLYFSK